MKNGFLIEVFDQQATGELLLRKSSETPILPLNFDISILKFITSEY
jgi:hypothetical protein